MEILEFCLPLHYIINNLSSLFKNFRFDTSYTCLSCGNLLKKSIETYASHCISFLQTLKFYNLGSTISLPFLAIICNAAKFYKDESSDSE